MSLRWKAIRRKKGAKPTVNFAIDHQMDPIGLSAVLNAMRKAGVDVPALALRQRQTLAGDVELYAIVGLNRYMDPKLAVFKGELVIGMLAYARTNL